MKEAKEEGLRTLGQEEPGGRRVGARRHPGYLTRRRDVSDLLKDVQMLAPVRLRFPDGAAGLF